MSADEMTSTKRDPRDDDNSKGVDWDYWFERETWSSFMAFLLLTGLLLMIALPFTIEVRQIPQTDLRLSELFPTVFVVLFGIFSISLGQAEISWGHRINIQAQFVQLASRLGLALLLTLPFWMTFLMGMSLSPVLIVPVYLHLALFGVVLGLMGWRLALTQFSEIFQFNLKYLSFFGFLTLTFFYTPVRFLNPIWPFQNIIDGDWALSGMAVFAHYGAWVGLGAIFAYLVYLAITQESTERTEHGDAVS